MSEDRLTGGFLTEPHCWLVEGMEDGKVWFTIGEKKYLFSCVEVSRLCLKLVNLVIDLPHDFREVREPIDGPAIDRPDIDVTMLIQTSEEAA